MGRGGLKNGFCSVWQMHMWFGCSSIPGGKSIPNSGDALHYDDLYNYFITYPNVIIKEIKCTISEISFNHHEIISLPTFVKKLSSRKLVPCDKRWGNVGLEDWFSISLSVFFLGDW